MLRAGMLSRTLVLLLPFLGLINAIILQVDPLYPLPADTIVINEVDVETPGTDKAEFIELYDGGAGETNLDGFVVVLFNGQDDRSYRSIDLSGHQTDSQGYFLLANEFLTNADITFPDNVLQNGPDAIALFSGQASDYPNGTAVTTTNLLDALVYDTDDPDDSGLLILLNSGEPQVDEDGHLLDEFQSNQRCPDGGGGQRNTSGYIQDMPTPKSANSCPNISDDAPEVNSTTPSAGSVDIAPDTNIIINFNEPVLVNSDWFSISCSQSGSHTASTSVNAASFTLDPTTNFSFSENCTVTLLADHVSDADTQDPPDHMAGNYSWSFTIESPTVATNIIINEVDVDTPGSDTAEFIELYDGGEGTTSLGGLLLIFFNGSSDTSYQTVDLNGYSTNALGYFLIGNTALHNTDLVIPDGSIQNGADAIALYQGSSSDFPSGTPVSTINLHDAIVYDTADADDPGLLTLLISGQPQVNEASRNNTALDSNQRCPNGSGGQRRTSTYLQNLPTPGTTNKCTFDSPPHIAETTPANGQQNIATSVSLTVKFSEAVQVTTDAFELICTASGTHSLTRSGGPIQYSLDPDPDLSPGESCTAKVLADEVHDQDSDDPPDQMAGDYSWTFSTKSIPVATNMLINEVDADTPGTDTAEFVELYDGGNGGTKLDGLSLVLFNGYNDTSYRAVDLDGYTTNGSGYFVIGGSEAPSVHLVLPNSHLQNGADAVALYTADSSSFPNGSAVTQNNLLDALVYDTNDEDDSGLLILLNPDQPQINEAARSQNETDSNQRCPNGQGGQRRSIGFLQNPATPGSANNCTIDTDPGFGDCGDPATPVHTIQGSSRTSPMDGTKAVTVEGIVVGDFQGQGALDGFFIQEEGGEQDSNPQTSEGIFIYDPSLLKDVESNDIVRVQGSVAELDGLTSLTELTEMMICGSGSSPNPKSVTLPVPALDSWEYMEGMLINLPQNLAVTSSEYLGNDGIVDLSLNDRLFHPTEIAEPGESAINNTDLNNRSRIKMDDGRIQLPSTSPPLYLRESDTLRIGDSLDELIGILSESSSGYHIQPTQPVSINAANQRPSLPNPEADIIRTAVFDTSGYFNGYTPESIQTEIEEFTRQRSKIINVILEMKADVIGLLSLENNGYTPNSAIQDLVNGLNESAPTGTNYQFINPGVPKLGASETTVGIVYQSEKITPLGSAIPISNHPFTETHSLPLLQAFSTVDSGESFLLVVAQFHNRQQCPQSDSPNADQNDGQACWNALRVEAATTLTSVLDTNPTGIDDTDTLILGNLNAYSYEDPIDIFIEDAYINLASHNLSGSYTSEIDGQSGVLLHAFASTNLVLQTSTIYQWHINADEPSILDYRLTNPPNLYAPTSYRSSEHDPVIVDLLLDPDPKPEIKVQMPIIYKESP